MLATVGRDGEPGADVRCVISVAMLTEGWDARTVTNIVGFRAFGTQLLCEQVTGRALRRTSYDALRPPDEAGRRLFEAEYADVVGIPFEFMPAMESRPAAPQPPKPRTWVCNVAGRSGLRVSWPQVEQYLRVAPQGGFKLRPERVQPWSPPAGKVATMAALEGVAGEESLISALDPAGRRRGAELHLAAELTRRVTDREAGVPPAATGRLAGGPGSVGADSVGADSVGADSVGADSVGAGSDGGEGPGEAPGCDGNGAGTPGAGVEGGTDSGSTAARQRLDSGSTAARHRRGGPVGAVPLGAGRGSGLGGAPRGEPVHRAPAGVGDRQRTAHRGRRGGAGRLRALRISDGSTRPAGAAPAAGRHRRGGLRDHSGAHLGGDALGAVPRRVPLPAGAAHRTSPRFPPAGAPLGPQLRPGLDDPLPLRGRLAALRARLRGLLGNPRRRGGEPHRGMQGRDGRQGRGRGPLDCRALDSLRRGNR